MLLALAASSGLSRSTTPGSTPCCTAMRYRQSPSFTTYPPGTGPRSATAPSAAPFVAFVVGAAPMGACAESGGGGSGRGGGAWDRPWCGFGCECDRSERGGVAGIRWGLGREEADAEPARDRKPPLPSRWSRSILACARGSIESGRGGGSQRGVRDGRVNRRYEGADGEGGKEINGRGGAPRGRARGGRVARTPTRTPSTPRTEPSTRSVGLVERGDAPGSRWRRPPSPPLSSGGCCRTAWAPPHPRCRRMSTTRRCPARVAGCATRTCCSRGSSRAGRGFLCAAWSAPNVARGAVWREFQEIFQVVITEIKQLGF